MSVFPSSAATALFPLVTVCLSVTDGDHQAPPRALSGVPFITISVISEGRIAIDRATRFVPRQYFDGLSISRKAKTGDVLFSVAGSLGISALVGDQTEFVFQRHIAILRPSEFLVPSFLYNMVSSPQFRETAEKTATGTAQLTIPLSKLRESLLPLPSVAEQRRIVAKIDRLSARSKRARDELDQVEATIKDYKGALLQQAFRGELTAYWRKIWPGECAKSYENLDEERQAAVDGWNADRSRSRRYEVAREPSWQPQFDLPQAWRWTSVDAISSAVQYGSSAKTTSDASGVVVLRMGNLQRGKIDVSDVRYLPEDHEEFPDLLLRQGDILFNRTNSFELVGKLLSLMKFNRLPLLRI